MQLPGGIPAPTPLGHHKYFWRVQLADGHWVSQFDEQGQQRSIAQLAYEQVRRIELRPRIAHLPIFDLRIGPGERWIKHWDCLLYEGAQPEVAEVLGLVTREGEPVYILHEPRENRIIISSEYNPRF